jgi:hypothetical protein
MTGVGGSFTGDITVHGSVGGPLTWVEIDDTYEGTFRIGQDLDDDIIIRGDPGSGKGLKGQIIVNANASTGDPGVWHQAAVVTIGSTELTWNQYGEYPETAEALGGGAVGLVPFSTHRESCSPVHGTVKKGTPTSITLQFYGPVVQENPGTDMPVKVYREDFGGGGTPLDITSDCSVTMSPGGDPKKVQIVGDTVQFKPKYRYRLVPITSSPGTGETRLLCDDLLASGAVPVKGREYWVDVDLAFTMSMLDLSNSGWVDSPDAVEWVNSPQDFDGDNTADAGDLQLILDNLGEPVK